MQYDKNSFLAGLAVGRQLKGWGAASRRPQPVPVYNNYLQFFGQEWIDSDYLATPYTRILIVATIRPVMPPSGLFLFGSRSGAYSADSFAFVASGNSLGYFGLQSGGAAGSAAPGRDVYDTKMRFDVTRYNATWEAVDGTLTGQITLENAHPANSLYPLTIGTLYGWGSGCAITGKIYGFTIYEGSELVRDYRPALAENQTACLHEIMEDRYYYNAGSGSLIYGSDS
jgi:hypothetical protein